MENLNEFLVDWSAKKTINGKSFDEVFQIEGIPLWWFYRRYFSSHVIPAKINPYRCIEKNIPISVKDKVKYSINARLLEKYLNFNENRKIKFFKPKISHSNEEKILFLTYTNHLVEGELFRFQGMVDKVKKDGKYKDLVLFADPLSSRSYKKLSGRSTFYEYYDDDISTQAKLDAELWFKQWKMIDEQIKYDMFKLEDKSFWPYFKYPFSFYFSKTFFYFISLYYRISKKIIDKENIKTIVVSSQSGFFEKCMLAVASKKNVPVFQVQHGIGSGVLELTYNTKRLVFSNFHKQELMEAGVREEDIIVVGPIIFDQTFEFVQKPKTKQGKNILIATSHFIESNFISKKEYFLKISKLLKGIKHLNDFKIIIKLHPREKYEKDYFLAAKQIGLDNTSVLKDISRNEFYTLISNCDLFINFGSTAAFEAVIIGRPVINIDLVGIMDSYLKDTVCTIMLNSKACVNVNVVDGINKAVISTLDNKELSLERKKFIKKYCYKLDGKASERAVDAIYQIINHSK